MKDMIDKYAASMSNPPPRFRNLDVAFKFHKWCEDNNMTHHSLHKKAVELFCKETGEEYKKDWW